MRHVLPLLLLEIGRKHNAPALPESLQYVLVRVLPALYGIFVRGIYGFDGPDYAARRNAPSATRSGARQRRLHGSAAHHPISAGGQGSGNPTTLENRSPFRNTQRPLSASNRLIVRSASGSGRSAQGLIASTGCHFSSRSFP